MPPHEWEWAQPTQGPRYLNSGHTEAALWDSRMGPSGSLAPPWLQPCQDQVAPIMRVTLTLHVIPQTPCFQVPYWVSLWPPCYLDRLVSCCPWTSVLPIEGFRAPILPWHLLPSPG